MKTCKCMLVTVAAQTVALTVAVATGYLAVTALPAVVPMMLIMSYWMSR